MDSCKQMRTNAKTNNPPLILQQNHFLDIMFLLRSLVHSGSPLSTVAETLVNDIGFRNEHLHSLKRTQKDWICRLLTAGNSSQIKGDENDSNFNRILGLGIP